MEELIVIIACLFLNALLSAFEMAFVSVPRHELRRLARTGNKDAQRLLGLRESPERTLSVIQVGITLVAVLSSAVGGAAAEESITPYLRTTLGLSENTAEFSAILLVVAPITYLSVVIGELVPKSLALRNPVRITCWGAKWLFIADHLLSPLVGFLEWSTKRVLDLRFLRTKREPVTPEAAVELDTLAQHHQQAVLNLAQIERKRVIDILVPWKEVTSVKISDGMEEVAVLILTSGHTRLPVTDDGATVGVLHTKEFLSLRETGAKVWKSLVRPALIVQPKDSILSTLRVLQRNRSHMAIVVGPGPSCIGIVTLEDISEEIWGEIYDEDDDGRVQKILAARVRSRGMR